MYDDDDVRVGDRFDFGDEKITITEIDLRHNQIQYASLSAGAKRSYVANHRLPLPVAWVRVGRGPVPASVDPELETCINHPLRDRELGTLYCPECVDQKAQDWSGTPIERAKSLYAALEREARKHG